MPASQFLVSRAPANLEFLENILGSLVVKNDKNVANDLEDAIYSAGAKVRRLFLKITMRTDILPLCDEHYRTMELCIAPFSTDYSIEFFKCTAQFCRRCFSERLGYVVPQREMMPLIAPNQPRCDHHNRPMFISSLDRQRNIIRYACPEASCPATGSKSLLV